MNASMSYEEFLDEIKQGIIMDNGLCPVTPLLLMLQGKWKAQICYALCMNEIARFGQLKRDLPGISNAMLTSCLRELEQDGLISRRQFNEIPPRVEYSFTELGADLKPVFYQIMLWGFRHEKELEKYVPNIKNTIK